jgi:hypothetical protein
MDTPIEVGFQVFLLGEDEEFGAVRAMDPVHDEIVVYVENGGDFTVPIAAVRSVHDGKVVLDAAQLDPAVRRAIAHAHDREDPEP